MKNIYNASILHVVFSLWMTQFVNATIIFYLHLQQTKINSEVMVINHNDLSFLNLSYAYDNSTRVYVYTLLIFCGGIVIWTDTAKNNVV